jgi:hypothetical protein
VRALDAREAVADLVGDRTGLLVDRLSFSLLPPGLLCIAPAVGFFLACNPGQVARTQDRLGTLSPHQTPSSNAPNKLPSYQEQDQRADQRQPWIVEQEPHACPARV